MNKYRFHTENGGFKADKSREPNAPRDLSGLKPTFAVFHRLIAGLARCCSPKQYLCGVGSVLNMRIFSALVRTNMRILSFNVPQVKAQMFLYKFAECMSMRTLAVQPANP